MINKSFIAAGAFWACVCLLATPTWAQTQSVEASKPLVLTTQSADFLLQFDWMPTNGANPMLTLSNGQAIPLQNSKVGKLPGLWQTVSLSYQAARKGMPPMLNKLLINGVTVQEGANLIAGKASGQPVQLTVASGSATVRNVVVRPLADRSVASWAGPVTYKLYKGSFENRAELDNQKPMKTDTDAGINYNVSYGQSGRFTILFDGKLNVPAAGDYILDLQMGGVAGVWVDGKPVIQMTYRDLVDPVSQPINLAAGTHDVQVAFARSWPAPGLGLFISQPDTRPQALHVSGSLPEVTPISTMLAQPEPRPTLIRSFVQMPGEVSKRTHALSVGSQTGMHYSVDLNQMALLMAWKGNFADVTQMWYERGEPQLLQSAGTTVRPAPRTALAPLASNTAAWPDSLGTNVLQYTGLVLDKEGNPAAEYTLAGTTVRDQIRASANALARTLTINGASSSPLYCRLAASKNIEEVDKGLYAIDDRSYFVRLDPKAPVSIRQSGGKQELVMPVALKNGNATISYSLEF
ncbi:hypothetical protein ACAW74_13825 [Fibrella sp. WM1]|uniref:hypothetical protein n=1 Tax=Fibrella musci TaxID=3242485 RepID=UPI003520A58A